MRQLAISTLRRFFDVRRGTLHWKRKPCKRIVAGAKAGTVDGDGYVCVVLFGRRLKAHRIVYALRHGRWPRGDVDHRNGARSDNRPKNLRDCTRQQNLQNRTHLSRRNSSGVTGVTRAPGNRWRAEICVDYKTIVLAVVDTVDEAAAIRRDGEALFFTHAPKGLL